MSALGHKRTFAVQNAMSALHPIADMCGAKRHVRFVPEADMCGATNDVCYGPIADIGIGRGLSSDFRSLHIEHVRQLSFPRRLSSQRAKKPRALWAAYWWPAL